MMQNGVTEPRVDLSQCSEFRPLLAAFHVDGLTFMELASQHLDCQQVLQFALDGPFEGARAVIGIIAHLGQVGACLGADNQLIATLCQQGSAKTIPLPGICL